MRLSSKKQLTPTSKAKWSKTQKDRVTLDRVFSKLGILSRTDALKKIVAGSVTVNGKVVCNPNTWVSLTRDRIRCDGLIVRKQKKVYLMFYKPKGVVTTHRDPGYRKTVYDYLSGIKEWVFPVGRLDKDTSGLLILTNDTYFSETLTNPLSKISKTYQVKVNFHLSAEQLQRLEQGITLKNGEVTLPARVQIIRYTEKYTYLDMVIIEGKNRQIRRMIEALDGQVLKLVRKRVGNLSLGDLQVGQFRYLDHRDLIQLRESPPDNRLSFATA
jgi:23S rRNA pseudouridine2605 synthase